jgi:isoaspartyl peptidase/L-asparaginase-like protein (Ntn-hydrolase superfamily)
VALAALRRDPDPLEAAVAGVVVLEDDPRFNAGTGSVVRLDGSIQMDASVMDSTGRFGAVAAVERVKNVVRVARAVVETPHLFLAGDGATRFARTLGLPDYDPTTPERRAATERLRRELNLGGEELPEFWRSGAWRARWNYESSADADRDLGCDTVGCAVRAPDGRFGVALSTGGTAIMLRGRVGDVPIYGAGLYAGAHGAAAATGHGERIVEKILAHTVHGWLAAGVGATEATRRAVALIPSPASIGIIVITATELSAAADRSMAWAGREDGGDWIGPPPGPRETEAEVGKTAPM